MEQRLIKQRKIKNNLAKISQGLTLFWVQTIFKEHQIKKKIIIKTTEKNVKDSI